MTVCAYRQEDGLFSDFSRVSGDLNGIGGFSMSEPEAGTFKHFMGTFLLRRAQYLSEAGHHAPALAGQGGDEMKSFHPHLLTSPSLR